MASGGGGVDSRMRLPDVTDIMSGICRQLLLGPHFLTASPQQLVGDALQN